MPSLVGLNLIRVKRKIKEKIAMKFALNEPVPINSQSIHWYNKNESFVRINITTKNSLLNEKRPFVRKLYDKRIFHSCIVITFLSTESWPIA